MDITPQQLRCFVAVAENLHFGRAADSLHLSPSTVSENVAALERRTGHDLLRRSRSVSLTAAGEDLLPLAREALSALDAVGAWGTAARSRATIRVGLMVSSRRFRTVMAHATAAMPDVTWEIKHLGFEGSHRALAHNEVDCAFLTEAGDGPTHLDAARLWDEGSVVVLRDDHPLAQRGAIRRDDLAGQTVIMGPTTGASAVWTQALLGDTADLHIRPIAQNFDEILELCGMGAGINIAGESAAEAYARPGLRFVPTTGLPRLTTYLCRRPDPPGPELDRFVQVVSTAAQTVDG
ncbi:LysR family transcriptional regulator [Gordonia sp. LSe1-13]|uniref:LysR family transcriptional regulator n=1 Tax=Gordonia sesuvii TaxID=3116777 RepID=A0ABU7MFY7_9ACTN|nr:LysR family transcriptional regulator [Gordonia sp. LSe1-13]